MPTFWNKRQGFLGRHKHLPSDILTEEGEESAAGVGLTVDNQSDPPAEVTTIIALGADVSTPGEATLSGGPVEFLSKTVVFDRDAIRAMVQHVPEGDGFVPGEVIAPTEILDYVGAPTSIPILSWAVAVLDLDGAAFTNPPSPVNLVLAWGSNWSLTIGKVMDGQSPTDVADVNVGLYGGGGTNTPYWMPFSSLTRDAPAWFFEALKDNGVYIILAGDGGIGETVGPLTGGGANATLTVRIQYTVIDL